MTKLHVMIDVETLGVGRNPPIVSLGACAFLKKGIIGDFYHVVHLEQECLSRADLSTVLWWLRQDERARAIFKQEPGAGGQMLVPEEFLYPLFNKWVEDTMTRERATSVEFWANGADLDWLESRYAALEQTIRLQHVEGGTAIIPGHRAPWRYNQKNDFRTVKKLLPRLQLPDEGTAHNAKDDAVWQAKYLMKLMDVHQLWPAEDKVEKKLVLPDPVPPPSAEPPQEPGKSCVVDGTGECEACQ